MARTKGKMATKQTIKKSRQKAKFLTLPNQTAQDSNLSYEALGMLTYIQSLPEDWVLHVSTLPRHGCGRDKAYRLINELIEKGYAKRERILNDKKQVICIEYEVSDIPIFATKVDAENQALSTKPLPEKPDMEKPDMENQELQKKQYTKEIKNKNIAPKDASNGNAVKKSNPVFDWFSMKVFRIDPYNEAHKAELKRNVGRIGKLLKYANDKGATVEQLDSFKRWYENKYPKMDLPKDDGKFSSHFKDYLDSIVIEAKAHVTAAPSVADTQAALSELMKGV